MTPTPRDRRVQVRIPLPMYERMEKHARERGTTVSTLLRLAASERFLLPQNGTNSDTIGTQGDTEAAAVPA